MQLKLDTSYTETGNSSGQQIDTLAIAIDGRDYNDLEEYNWDWWCEVEDNAKSYWLDQNGESYFQQTLTKEQAKHYADNLDEYEQALTEYKNEHFEEVRAGDWPIADDKAQQECANAMEEDLSDAQKQLYKDWLHGDYRGNFDGILPQANKLWREYGISFDYDEEKDVVSIEIEEDTIATMFEDGEIEKKSKKAVREWVEMQIDYVARAKHDKEMKEREARMEENKKTREYQKKRAEEVRENKRNELLQLHN